jgi:4a-hydroxytetrahydrobiopterin dehydratase
MERGPNDRFSEEQIAESLKGLAGWSFVDGHIEKSYRRQNFLDAVGFIKQIGDLAESQDHHPDLLLYDYRNVRVMLSTHSAGGITQNDIDLARALETLA